jgi:hypothetical protein
LRWLAAHQRGRRQLALQSHLLGGNGCPHCSHPGHARQLDVGRDRLWRCCRFSAPGKRTSSRRVSPRRFVKALEFLKKRMPSRRRWAADLQDGVTLYAQGIATLALCEAYALTRRSARSRRRAARRSRFIVNAQDKKRRRLAVLSRSGRRHDGHRLDADGA